MSKRAEIPPSCCARGRPPPGAHRHGQGRDNSHWRRRFRWWQANNAAATDAGPVVLWRDGNADPDEGETILFDRTDFASQGSWYLAVHANFPYWLGQATYPWHGEWAARIQAGRGT